MKILGLTGGIGSGKSTVATVFEHLGIPVFTADAEAKQCYLLPAVREDVVNLLGQKAYKENGLPDFSFIAGKVFTDVKMLEKLNQIIHPVVANKFAQWKNEHSDADYGVKEAAIFFESGLNAEIKNVLLVAAPVELRIERVMQRDNCAREDVINRIARQLPEEELRPRCRFVLENDGGSLLVPVILSIHQKMIEEAEK